MLYFCPKQMNVGSKGEKNWYAIYTQPRSEKKVSDRLNLQLIEVYLPLQSKLKQWSDRKKWTQEPLLHSYVFVKTDLKNYYEILNTPGVVKFVTFEQTPAVIRQSDINLIKLLLADYHDIEVSYEGILPQGTEVIVKAGPFKGMQGKLVDYKGKKITVVDFQQMGFNLMLQLPLNIIEPVTVLKVA
jgi:transcriptional antiterminator RfaH